MIKKLTRMCRLSLPVISLMLFFSVASVASQIPAKISLKASNITLAYLFKTVKKQTGLTVFYSNALLDDSQTISVDFEAAELAEVMTVALRGKQLDWVVKNKYIVLQKSAANSTPKKDNAESTTLKAEISGRVTDETDGPLPGVSIRVKGSTNGTQTDNDGRYKIIATNADILTFSYLGYAPQEIPVGAQTTINVKLKVANQDLGEIVIVGYGKQQKTSLTGSVSQISGKDIAVRPVGQTSAALQGMAPGVTVRQSSGRPGGDAGTIRIRGVGTLSDPNPLVMIDGIEGSMNNIDPNLIESISVLKDAASSSIYGSRAANGVILITTKRANVDQVGISYNNYIGWQNPTNMPDIVDALDHMLLTNEAYVNTGRTPLYSSSLIEQYRAQNGVSSDAYPNTDWQKETLTGSGLQQSHFLTVQGGTNKVRLLGSFGLLDQKGVIQNSAISFPDSPGLKLYE